jgi:hypothetical protein
VRPAGAPGGRDPAEAGDPAEGDDPVGEGRAWGLSTAVDLRDCDSAAIRDAAGIEAFVVRLCARLGVRRFGSCQIVHFGEGRVAGYSMTQLIETSLVSGHFVDATNRAYLDVFSCKGYDPAVVAAVAREAFGGTVSAVAVTLRR